ncbi:MAG: phosphatase [Clostridiales bacterium]|nr:phosphatase [Clostridiales bacterium]
MELHMFGAIYVGSYEVSLKVFEFNSKKKIHELDFIRARMDLGSSILETGSIDYKQVDELCVTLKEFVHILEGYRVMDYEAYASPVFNDADNLLFTLNQIKLYTGVNIRIMTNAENRFLSYRTVAERKQFEDMIQKSAAVVDIGGTAAQITIFRKGEIVTTQNMGVGSVKIHSLWAEGHTQNYYQSQTEEYITARLEEFSMLYLDKHVEYLVIMNDYCREVVKKLEKNPQDESLIASESFVKYIDELLAKDVVSISEELELTDEEDELIMPSLILFKQMVGMTGAKEVWSPKLSIADGIARAYGLSHKLIRSTHDYDRDVISASYQIAKHYHCESTQIEDLVVKIFDTIRKMHGLGKRARLLLRVASILQDCGKYVSLSDSANCSHNIIMFSEIIGLSYTERKVVALTVLYNTLELPDYEYISDEIDQDNYLVVAKLSAILRVANALNQSHQKKFTDMRIQAKGRELIFAVEATQDISLEQELFEAKTSYFETVFGMKPILRKKRVYSVTSQM